MKDNFDIRHWLSLSLIDDLGPKSIARLLRAFGSPGEILTAPTSELKVHVKPEIADKIGRKENNAAIKATLKWVESNDNCRILTIADDDYPPFLLEIADAPPVLYARGDLSLMQKTLVSIVGSRSASAVGAYNTKIFARALSEAGLGVVSGLAQGIDTAAHSGALLGKGGTIAVVGTGIDIIYPKINRSLAAEIAEKGLILSEFPLGCKPHQSNFPRRNRIISGMAHACLVMEATLKSGSLITAKLAAEQGREVFAVPGSINSPLHRGCHQLIKQGARLTENVHDILEELNIILSAPLTDTAPEKIIANINILNHVNYEPTALDDIVAGSGIDAEALLSELLELEMNGHIVCTTGGRYQRL